MRKYLLLPGLLFCLVGKFPLLAQLTPTKQYPALRTNVPELKRLFTQFRESYRDNKERALSLARRNNWFIQKVTRDGIIYSLQGIDEHDLPIYYATDNNTLAAATTRTNQLQSGGSLGLNLTGGSTVLSGKLGIWEVGSAVRASHREFNGRVAQIDNALLGEGNISTHATHVAGTMIAAGLNPVAKGMAPAANLKAWQVDSTNANSDVPAITTAAANLLLSNHSYGEIMGWDLDSSLPGDADSLKWRWYGDPSVSATEDYRFGFYGNKSHQIDQIAFNAPYYLMVKSAGNDRGTNGPPPGTTYYLGSGTSKISSIPRKKQENYDLLGPFSNAKNILTVGAAYALTNGYSDPAQVRIAPFSSWGPTDDGRIKPDLVGDGINVTSTSGTADNAYTSLSGTSMSAPNVTGSLLLLQELYATLHPGKSGNDRFMRAASLKGLVLHTADEAGLSPGPDYTYGWGLLNAERAARLLLNTDQNHQLTERVLKQSETYTVQVIASGKGPLTATISWTDPQGTVLDIASANVNNRTPRLVNDLDVRISEGTSSLLPWVLDPDNPANPATRGDNIRDNVEQVLVPNTVPGKLYTVSIRHKGTLTNGLQAYSLLMSGITTATYCTSGPINSADSRINNVTFGETKAGINNSPVAGCTSYSDFTNQFASIGVDQEIPVPLRVTLGTCGGNFNKVAKVFIDWNGDKDFNDGNELVATSGIVNGTGTFTADVSIPAGMNIGFLTRMRVVCVETADANAVSACGNYTKGETQDYSLQFVQPTTDVGVASLLSPEQGFCNNPTEKITVEIQNFGSAAQRNIAVTTVVTNATGIVATLSGTFADTLAPSAQRRVKLNGTFNAEASTSYTFTSSTALPGDLKASNDQHVATRVASEVVPAPSVTAAQCGADPVTLKGRGNGTFYWYDAPTGGNLLAVGNPAMETAIPANRTFYAGLNDFRGTAGVASRTVYASGGYNQFTPSLLVSAQVPLVLESTRLYIGHSGTITFTVEKPDGSLVSSTVLDVTATRNPPGTGVQQIDPNDTGAVYDLHLPIPVGDYQVAITYGEGATIFRNNNLANSAYPYTIPGVFAITGNTATNASGATFSSYYYYFYDLKIKAAGCPSLRTPVVASAESPLPASITVAGNTLLCSGERATLRANTGTDYTYQWKKNGNPISNTNSSTYEAGEAGGYSVEISSGNCLAVSNTIVVSTFQVPVVTVDGAVLTSSQPEFNQWLLNGIEIPGATQATYQATQSGRYSVRASQAGCPPLTSNEVSIVITATDNDPLAAGLRLYPNPVTERLTVEYVPTSLVTEVSAVLYNALGAELSTQLLQNESGVLKGVFRVTQLTNGPYFIRITDNRKVFVKTFMKQ